MGEKATFTFTMRRFSTTLIQAQVRSKSICSTRNRSLA
ncbi:hypothetical protein BSU04_31680 [Caballeronia sordidicola]|uniref:Uncharacterized protein n=1 Tax=Caballeronia sordidicola TaxID=196367 RepID=A0A226WTE2_CABSO|nr:hypothetical protein BSU04_31680 [Caballeronia sordidicola]